MMNLMTKEMFGTTFIFIMRQELLDIVKFLTTDILIPIFSIFMDVKEFKQFSITVWGKKIVIGKLILKLMTSVIVLYSFYLIFGKK